MRFEAVVDYHFAWFEILILQDGTIPLHFGAYFCHEVVEYFLENGGVDIINMPTKVCI